MEIVEVAEVALTSLGGCATEEVVCAASLQ